MRQYSVYEILKSCTRGKIVLNTFKEHQKINSQFLTNALIDYGFDHDPTGSYKYYVSPANIIFEQFFFRINLIHKNIFYYRISSEKFFQIATEIGTIFATEGRSAEKTAKLFYYPYQKSTKDSESVNAGGSLYDRYLYVRSKLIYC